MIKCPACEKLITPSCIIYKASIGFLDTEGMFIEDISVTMHQECYYDYRYNPFDKLEDDLRNS
tara:strand:- start:308 stop:496 length:189 start_codon:yes stop_codon:yes gene_type:complete